MHNIIPTKVRNGKLSLRMFFFFAIILLAVVSTTWWLTRSYYDKSKATDRAFRRLDSSLSISSKFLLEECMEDSSYVHLKARQPAYWKIKEMYKPKIDSVMRITREMHAYIQSIKQSLNSSTDKTEENGRKSYSQPKENKNWNHNMAKNLYDSLNSYSKLLLKIFPFKTEQSNISVPIDTSKTFFKSAETWMQTNFANLTELAVLSSLTEIDFQVWLSAKRMTDVICSQWCDILQLNDNGRYFLTNQNSNYFLPGQTLEINAGLGAYVTNIKPTIFIDGQKQVVNAEGYAIFKKIIIGGKGGSIPVVISYTDPSTGQLQTMSKSVRYTVFQAQKK